MRLCRAIDPPVGCCLFVFCILYLVFLCVRLFNRIFIGFACVSPLQHLFPIFWGVLSSCSHYHCQLRPLRSLWSRALPLSLSGLLFFWRLFVFYFVLIFLAILLSCLSFYTFSIFSFYDVWNIDRFLWPLLWAISCITTNCCLLRWTVTKEVFRLFYKV